jgi:hypothetical protein
MLDGSLLNLLYIMATCIGIFILIGLGSLCKCGIDYCRRRNNPRTLNESMTENLITVP